jgi:hypothetical protein
VKLGGVIHKLGIAVMAAGVVLFAYSFIRTATADSGVCSGSDCLKGEMRWALLVPASILAFVSGFLMLYFGGRGYGRTAGPRSFGEVDSGAWAPREREAVAPVEPSRRRWTRTWRNTYLLVGAGEVGLALLFVIATVMQPATRRGLLPTAGILGLVGVVFLAVGRRAAQKDRLHETGLEGEATIVGVEQTGMLMNENPYARLDLVVRVPGHPPYEVRHREIVPQVMLGRLTSGSPLPVRVDPNRPSHLLIQWERL